MQGHSSLALVRHIMSTTPLVDSFVLEKFYNGSVAEMERYFSLEYAYYVSKPGPTAPDTV